MRFIGVVLALFIVVSMGGCTLLGVSKEDTAMIRNLKEDIMAMGKERYESVEALRAEIKAVYEKVDSQKIVIMDKVEAKTITLAEAERFMASIEREGEYIVSRLKDELEMLKLDKLIDKLKK